MLARKMPQLRYAVEAACADLEVAHRLTGPCHPWTRVQVERMNRTVKDTTA
jgi:transposase InsO family protein